jgi:hypothetical protein
MNIIRFDVFIHDGQVLRSLLHVRCNGIDYIAKRIHTITEVEANDGGEDWLRQVIKADMRAEVMRQLEDDVFREWEKA